MVGPPLWKIWSVNWADDIPNINGKIPKMATKPPTSCDSSISSIVSCINSWWTPILQSLIIVSSNHLNHLLKYNRAIHVVRVKNHQLVCCFGHSSFSWQADINGRTYSISFWAVPLEKKTKKTLVKGMPGPFLVLKFWTTLACSPAKALGLKPSMLPGHLNTWAAHDFLHEMSCVPYQ